MDHFQLFAQPWWANLLIFIPVLTCWLLRSKPVSSPTTQLLFLGVFGISFAFVEAAVVVYLRAIAGFLPGFTEGFQKIWLYAGQYQQNLALARLPNTLVAIEFIRELATILMLASIAWVAGSRFKERLVFFLWASVFWDLFYYVFLWLLIRWPQGLTTSDVLFLVPVPWYGQVWFPLFVDVVTIAVIAVAARRYRNKITVRADSF